MSSTTLLHFCFRRGSLVGAHAELPDDPSDWNWERRAPGVGCNHLVCERCGAKVRTRVGWALEWGNKEEAAALYEADDWSGFSWVKTGPQWAAHRFYACRCRHTSEDQGTTLGLYDDVPGGRSVWGCAGHPPATLPLRVFGVSIDAETDLTPLVQRHWDRSTEPTAPEEVLLRRLADTPLQGRVHEAVTGLLQAHEPELQARALLLLARYPEPSATASLLAMSARSRPSLRSTPNPFGAGDLETLLIGALLAVPHTDPDAARAREVARETWRQPGALPDTLVRLANTDGHWLEAHLEQVVAVCPAAIDALLFHRYARTRNPGATARRVATLPGVDREVLVARVRTEMKEAWRPRVLAALGEP